MGDSPNQGRRLHRRPGLLVALELGIAAFGVELLLSALLAVVAVPAARLPLRFHPEARRNSGIGDVGELAEGEVL